MHPNVLRAAPALLLLCAAPALAQQALPGGLTPETPVHLSADRLVRDESGQVVAEGHVRLMSGPIHLAADRIVYDPDRQTARLAGSVLLVDGAFVARATQAFVDFPSKTGVLEEAALFQKRSPPAPDEVFRARDPNAVRALGENQLEVHAERVVRNADGSYVAQSPSVTTCDCGDRPPDWRIGASEARVSSQERMRLDWPVLYARGVPIFAAPFLSIPLTNERKSGLLLAAPHITGRRGPSYEQPLYLVLGKSYDMTVSAGYYFGHARRVEDPNGPAGAPMVEEDAFRGPRGSLEFRYEPRIGTSGKAFAAYGYDLSKKDGRQPGANPHRFAIQSDHRDDWGSGFADRLALNLLSDRNYLRDFIDDVVLRGEQTTRSVAWAGYRRDAALVVAEGVYEQDLRPAFASGVVAPAGFSESLRLFGHGARDTFQRAPAAAVDLARLEAFGLGLSLHLGAVRFAPWTVAGFGDVGRDGLGPGDTGYPGPDPDGSEGDRRFEDGDIPAADRLAIRPTVSLPLVLGDYLSLTPYAGWREQLYRYDGQGTGAASWGIAGVAAHTEIARTFAGGIRHAWIPRLEVRSLLRAHTRDAPARIYDELDMRPSRTTTQGRVALGSRLAGGELAVDVEVGQDAILTPGTELAETFAQASASLWPVNLSGLLQWDPHRSTVTEAVAGASLSDRRGDQLRASFRRLAAGGSSRLRAGPDELFSDAYFTEETRPLVLQELEQVGAGATVVPVRGLSLSYDFLLLPPLPWAKLLQQHASIGYESPCRCWAGTLHVAKRRNEGLDVWVSFNLGRL